MKEDLTIMLPAHNEERAIGALLDEIREEVSIPHQLLVIDNASTDATLRIALTKGAWVLPESKKGKGNAIRSGIERISTPYTIMLNSDLTYPPAYVKLIYRQLKLGADVVMGSRSIVDKGAMSHLHSFGNWGLSCLASILYGVHVQDLCTGFWGFKTSVLQKFNLQSQGFTLEADMLINTIRGNYKLRQIPVGYRSRPEDDQPKLHMGHGFEIAKFLVVSKWKKDGK